MKRPTVKAWLPNRVAREMAQEAERLFPLETGGVLLGYWVNSDEEVIITHATRPGPEAIHRPKSFIPDDEYQQAEIARTYEESGRLHTYLSDWHTHPNGSAILSCKDRRTLRKIAKCKDARVTIPIMALLANGEPEWYLGIWRFDPLQFGKLIIKNNVSPIEIKVYEE